MNQIIYQSSPNKFNNFANFVEKLNINHESLPEIFLNKDKLSAEKTNPDVSFQMSSQEIEQGVFKTIFDIKVSHSIKAHDKEAKCDKEYKIYNIEMIYVALTHIDNSANVPEIEKKKIVLVDVPYLIFPNIRFLVAHLTENMKATPVNINPINFAQLFVAESEGNKV